MLAADLQYFVLYFLVWIHAVKPFGNVLIMV